MIDKELLRKELALLEEQVGNLSEVVSGVKLQLTDTMVNSQRNTV